MIILANSLQMKDFLELYNRVTNHCFEKCVLNFNLKTVSPEEVSYLKFECASGCDMCFPLR